LFIPGKMGEILVFSRSDVDTEKVDIYMHVSCVTASSTTPKCRTIVMHSIDKINHFPYFDELHALYDGDIMIH
jgi:hypothetical protein